MVQEATAFFTEHAKVSAFDPLANFVWSDRDRCWFGTSIYSKGKRWQASIQKTFYNKESKHFEKTKYFEKTLQAKATFDKFLGTRDTRKSTLP